MKTLTKENTISLLLIIAIATPIAFIKLDSFPMRLWDESMFAVNSFEMLERGEFIIPYYKGEMNLWNSKPPLLLWIQMLSIKALGLNELAIRLPSAISAVATILLMFFFIRKHTNNILAWLTALVLITSTGYFTIHTGRTGDSDALLTLLLTSCNVIFLDSILSNNFSNKRILSFFILITFAFLCKSFASVLFSLGYLIIIFVKWSNIKKILSKTALWIGISLFLGICLSFLYLRNSMQEGYINFVFSTDIGRVSQEIESHKEPFLYYIESLSIYGFSFWFIPAIIGILMLFSKKLDKKTAELLKTTTILTLSFLLIISLSVSKLPWYTMPIYPFLSFFAALTIFQFIKKLETNKNVYLTTFIIFIYPYLHIFGKSQSNPYSSFENINEASERFVFNEINNQTFIDSTYVVHDGMDASLVFYKYKLQKQGKHLLLTDRIEFPKNATIIVSQNKFKEKIRNNYKFQLLDSLEYAIKIRITNETSKH